jgi:SAM-dependent methyltransferase
MNSLADSRAAGARAPAAAFAKSAAVYDLLYGDKDYAAEAAYVARHIRAVVPAASTVLELGSGTGRHGRLLAQSGFDVHGIERNAEMVAIAQSIGGAITDRPAGARGGTFTCSEGDLCSARIGRTFDAVIALFHVIGYQASNERLLAAFRLAAAHLAPGGVFLFDVWHGPAVLEIGPSSRAKEASDARLTVRRTASPRLNADAGTVDVLFRYECEDRATAAVERFDELHVMRYLFPAEVDLLARACGLVPVVQEEFMTGRPASGRTWTVMHGLRR